MTPRGNLPTRLTRRQWTAYLGAAAPLLAQGPPELAPAQQLPTEKAKAEVRTVSERLAQIDVPLDIEPAFAFKV